MPSKAFQTTAVSFSIDMDGCIYIPYTEDTLTTINQRIDQLTQHLIKKISKSHQDATDIYLFLGSARQTANIDHFSNYHHIKGRYQGDHIPSCFEVMSIIYRQLQAQLAQHNCQINVHLETLLLGDIAEQHEPGYYFRQYSRPSFFESDRDIDLDDFNDSDKLNIIYFQTKHLADKLAENSHIIFYLIDDRSDILRNNHHFFYRYPQYIPGNVKLDYLQFSRRHNRPKYVPIKTQLRTGYNQKLPAVLGQGFIHTPYNKLIKLCNFYQEKINLQQPQDGMQTDLYEKLEQIKTIATRYHNNNFDIEGHDKADFEDILENDCTIPGQLNFFKRFFCCSKERTDLAGVMETFYNHYIEPLHLTDEATYDYYPINNP